MKQKSLETKKIFSSSVYEQCLKTVLCGVDGDKSKVVESQSNGGNVWGSITKNVDCDAGQFSVTKIYKNNEYVGKIVYNFRTDTESEICCW